jgi:hypothetical protein
MLDPSETNIAIDANAPDRDGGERDALVDRFNALVEARTLTIVVAYGVRSEVENPRTPAEVKDAVKPRTFNLRAGLNAAQQEERRRVAATMPGQRQAWATCRWTPRTGGQVSARSAARSAAHACGSHRKMRRSPRRPRADRVGSVPDRSARWAHPYCDLAPAARPHSSMDEKCSLRSS